MPSALQFVMFGYKYLLLFSSKMNAYKCGVLKDIKLINKENKKRIKYKKNTVNATQLHVGMTVD